MPSCLPRPGEGGLVVVVVVRWQGSLLTEQLSVDAVRGSGLIRGRSSSPCSGFTGGAAVGDELRQQLNRLG